MTTVLYDVLMLAVLLVSIKPLGIYIAGVMAGENRFVNRIGGGIESFIYRVAGIDAQSEMDWKDYAMALLMFSISGVLVVYVLQRMQLWLPLNPQTLSNVSSDSAFNTAVSFVTNTNWQGYAGESTMSYLTQMLGLAVQNFVSAATGLAVAIALIRGLARHSVQTIGNFWIDLVRGTLYVLLPLSVVLALIFAASGVIQNFNAYKEVTTLESQTYQQPKLDVAGNTIKDTNGDVVQETINTQTQTLPMGPIASQEAIKQLGTNGGGFLNANSAHPFENPTPLSNFLQIYALLVISFSLTYTFGYMVGDTRQGWAVLSCMLILMTALLIVGQSSEQQGNPAFAAMNIDQASGPMQSGGNMEGKETRFGTSVSALFATATTGTSCGAVNAMHDSFMPLGGLVTLVMMQLGEVAPGGVGTGIYSMLVFAILAVFIAGLMIGRTPEYLGKKIEVFDMKMTSLTILVTPILVLLGTAIAVMSEDGRAGVANPGAHGFSEILYAFTSAANNNGSAFAGLSANTPFYNVALAVAMWLGRFWVIIPVLALAGSLAAKKRIPVTSGTMPTHGPLFVALLTGVVLLVGLLTYVPALALGPIVEHLMMRGV
ncbi:MAG TPA: potassium-transporting ATPase subunit KdpA [Steroidobacteraceae bacterium]|nr:potassium-transporting ATPase subunit KdpA [Steroidobacteraceae bacterium]